MLNTEATGFTKGMARPGYFYVTPNDTVKERFFETAYTDRDTAGSLILKLFPELVEGNGREVAAPYIKLTLAQSDEAVIPGNRFTLTAEVALPPDTHVYAPEVKGYKPIQLIMEASPDLKLLAVQYPKAKVLFLPVINESVPVYEGNFRLLQDGSVGRPDVRRLSHPGQDNYPERDTLLPSLRPREMLSASEIWSLLGCATYATGWREISGCDSA